MDMITEIPATTVQQWLSDLKSAGLARFDKDAAALIGVSPKSIHVMSKDGVRGDAAHRTAMAMSAALAGLQPYAA